MKRIFNKEEQFGLKASFPAEGVTFYEPFAGPDTTLMFLIRTITEASVEMSVSDSRTMVKALTLQGAYQSGALKNPVTFDDRNSDLIDTLDELIRLYNRKAGYDKPNMRIMVGHPKERSVIFQSVKWT